VIAGVVALAWNLREPSPPAYSTPKPVPFTSYPGDEEFPSFSPDGNMIAFSWNGQHQENFDIYVKALGSDSTPLRLTTNPAPDYWPAWSPDGRWIAFQRMGTEKTELMVIPALGGPERKLAEFSAGPPHVRTGFNPVWSPDSKWLIVAGVTGSRSPLYRIAFATGDTRQITDPAGPLADQWPAISPSGSTLLFTRLAPYNAGDLYRVGLDANMMPAGAPHRITVGEYPVVDASQWTPDGKEILVNTAPALVRIPTVGSDHPELLSWLGLDPRVSSFDVSRRGNRMVYSLIHGDANIWRIDLTAKTPRPERFIASTARDVYPKYSPDGTKIAFYSDRGGRPAQVFVCDSEGLDIRQLTFVTNGQAATPHWKPDGRMLTVDSNMSGSSQVYIVSPEGGKLTQLTHGPAAVSGATWSQGRATNFGALWSRDGRWMYFTSSRTGRDEIWKMPDGGGPAVQVTHFGGMMGVESEDGKTLFFAREADGGSLWKMPVSGGNAERIADSLYRSNFTVTKRGVYYMTGAGPDGTSVLKFYSFGDGGTSIITPIG
jgi:Tol biopolymer transport system component